MRKISLSNFTHLNKIKWRIFIPVQKAWYVKKIARGGWSGFGKALTWDPSQMITCHPKKIPKFLLKGGVVQFCRGEHLPKSYFQFWKTSQNLIFNFSVLKKRRKSNPQAKEEIFITDWWLSPELRLKVNPNHYKEHSVLFEPFHESVGEEN